MTQCKILVKNGTRNCAKKVFGNENMCTFHHNLEEKKNMKPLEKYVRKLPKELIYLILSFVELSFVCNSKSRYAKVYQIPLMREHDLIYRHHLMDLLGDRALLCLRNNQKPFPIDFKKSKPKMNILFPNLTNIVPFMIKNEDDFYRVAKKRCSTSTKLFEYMMRVYLHFEFREEEINERFNYAKSLVRRYVEWM